MTLSARFAEFALNLTCEQIPAEVARSARLHLLDTVGVCFASIGMEYADAIFGVVQDQGECADSTLLGSHRRAAAAWAAFYNGSLAHGNDFDDTHGVSLMHVSSMVIPAVLAVGELRQASGRDAITAAVAGYETGLRIGMAAPGAFHARGFHATSVCGVFAAAVSAALLLKLDATRIGHAIAICASQAAGSMEFLSEGAWSKRMQPGWAAHAGIVAAQLAARGYTGPTQALEGQYGFLNAYAGKRVGDADKVVEGLGRFWETLNIEFKPYPCGHFCHAYMDCALALRIRHDIALDAIEWIELRVPSTAVPIVCEPFADKQRPRNAYAAQFSLPYAVAVMLVAGSAGIDEFGEKRIRDPAVLALTERTRYAVDDTLPYPGAFPAWVRIKLRDGRVLEERTDSSRGSRERPLTDDEHYRKFSSNLSLSPPGASAEEIWNTGYRIDELDNIASFTKLLTPGPA